MKIKYIFLLIASIILIIAALTNPDKFQHKDAVKEKINAYLNDSLGKKSISDNDGVVNAGNALGLMFGEALINRLIEHIVSSDNYIFFSTTEITWEGKTKTIGIGVFGNVFLSSKLNTELKKEVLNK